MGVTLAATLTFSPTTGSYAQGSTFTVGVYTGSGESSINAVSGVVSYPQDKLEVISISKNQSIMSLWVQEPSFSNTKGTVNFEGIVLNPGFKGSQGKVLNLTFRVKSQGASSLSFSSASLLANDGEGTEILASKGTASFTLLPEVVVQSVQQEESLSSGPATLPPTITSATHTQDGWSSTTTGMFTFTFVRDTKALRLLLDDNPSSKPAVLYEPPIETKVIQDLPEGTSYLHVQSLGQQGWSEVIHYKIQVDTVAPQPFTVTEVAPLSFLFEAEDELSKIASYTVQINEETPVSFVDDGSHIYKITAIEEGVHVLTVTAFDGAGNTTESKISFTVIDKSVILEENDETLNGGIKQKGDFVIMILSIVIPFLALVVLLCGVLFATWKAFGGLRRHVAKEVAEAKAMTHKAFELLRTDLLEDIATLEKTSKKRKLTQAEAKILKRLRKNIDEAETVIAKEIGDIV